MTYHVTVITFQKRELCIQLFNNILAAQVPVELFRFCVFRPYFNLFIEDFSKKLDNIDHYTL